jgi:hypothetical protein
VESLVYGGASSNLLKKIFSKCVTFIYFLSAVLVFNSFLLSSFIQKVAKLQISYKISKSNNGKFPSWCRRLLMKFFNWQEAKGESTIPSSTPSLHLCQFAWWYRGLLVHCKFYAHKNYRDNYRDSLWVTWSPENYWLFW